MAPPQPITIIDPLPWPRSTATRLSLSELVTAGQLAANEDGRPVAWIVPQAGDREPNPLYGYVVSFIRFHKRGFAAPVSRFMRAVLPLRRGVAQLHAERDFTGSMTIALWNTRRELYVPCTMTSNNAEWERGWFYLRNDGAGLPPTPARC
jgi:hypothetical protein